MAMSRDRVRFTLIDNPNNRRANVDAATRAFGMSEQEANSAFTRNARIECRPSQFARFLIYRSASVDINRFKELDAEIVAARFNEVLDVSSNPAGC